MPIEVPLQRLADENITDVQVQKYSWPNNVGVMKRHKQKYAIYSSRKFLSLNHTSMPIGCAI